MMLNNCHCHRFPSGKQSSNLGRLQTDLTKICQTYLDWLGDARSPTVLTELHLYDVRQWQRLWRA